MKMSISFWSINNNFNFVKKINPLTHLLSWIPVVGFCFYVILLGIKLSRVNNRIFSNINYTWKDFWKQFFTHFSYPTYFTVFLFVCLSFFLYNFFNLNYSILLFSCSWISLFSFWISHLFFLSLTCKYFNQKIEGTRNKFYFLFLSNKFEKEFEKLFEYEINNFLIDAGNTNFFLERFSKDYFKDFTNPSEPWRLRYWVRDLTLEKIQEKIFQKTKKLNINVLRYFYFIYLKRLNSNINRNYFQTKTKEFNEYFSIFQSSIATKIFLKKINIFSFRKYLYVFLYFLIMEFFVLLSFDLFYVLYSGNFSFVKMDRGDISIFVLLTILFFIIFWFVWRLWLRYWCWFSEIYALKYASLEILKTNNEKEITKRVKIFLNFNNCSSKLNDWLLNKSKNFLVKQEEKIKKEISNLLSFFKKTHFKIMYKFIEIYCKSTIILKVLLILYPIITLLAIQFLSDYYLGDVVSLHLIMFVFHIIFFLYIFGFLSINLYLLTIKTKIQKLNFVFNQRFFYPYLTSYCELTSFFVISQFEYFSDFRKIWSLCYLNLWNHEYRRGMPLVKNNKKINYLVEELETFKNSISTFGLKEIMNESMQDSFYSNKFSLLEIVMRDINEYIDPDDLQ